MDIDLLMESEGLFRTSFPEGYSFVWRLLTLKEYQKFKILKDSNAMNAFFLHTLVFERCYVGNPNTLHRDLPAGIPIGIGECIMWLSGECEMQTLVDDIASSRENYPHDSVKEYMKRIIYTAWPSYTEEQANDWTYPQLIRKFSIAENVLVNRGTGYEKLDLRKIHGPDGPKKTPGVAQLQDMKNENRELNKAMGDGSHPLDKAPDELAGIQKRGKGRLSRKSARQLDKRRG